MPSHKKFNLKNRSYYKTGGECEIFHAPSSVDELISNIKETQINNLEYFILGAGSNSLVLDQNFKGAVFSFENLTKISLQNDIIFCQAGVENSEFAKYAKENNFANAEWMNGLPGQIGGTTRMNARCYGGEISQITKTIHTVNTKGDKKSYNSSEAFRGYKDTIFMDNDEWIWAVEFKLGKNEKIDEEKMSFCLTDRTNKGQYLFPSCGCVFKNNYSIGVSSGALLEQAGVKKLSFGGARVSDKHANFIYNIKASSDDILELSLLMREQVWQKFNIWLEYEMEILGNLPKKFKEAINEKRVNNPRFNLIKK